VLPVFSCASAFSPFIQASGVGVSQECLTEYGNMKMYKAYRYVVFKLTEDLKEIKVAEKGARGEHTGTHCWVKCHVSIYVYLSRCQLLLMCLLLVVPVRRLFKNRL